MDQFETGKAIETFEIRVQRIIKRFSDSMQSSGYHQSKNLYFTKVDEHWGFWIHLVVPEYPDWNFEVEFGIRVLNESLPALHLNGSRYGKKDRAIVEELVDSDESEEKCYVELFEVVRENVLAFFKKHSTPDALLKEGSPLHGTAKTGLRKSLSGDIDEGLVVRSLRLLGKAPSM
jgi:hypothetical protein